MKKILVTLSIILISVLILSSCNTENQETPDDSSILPETSLDSSDATNSQSKEDYTASMFFSYKENTKYVYEGHGNEYASFVVYIDFLNSNTAQTRTNNGGTEVVRVIKNLGDTLTVTTQVAEIYFRENFLENSDNYNEVLLMEPIALGTKWDIPEERERFISAIDKEITTPFGSFEAVETTTVSKISEDIVLDYYVKDIGHVKTIYKSAEGSGEEFEIVSELVQILENQKLVQLVDFHFPDFEKEKLFIYTRQLEFSTNDSTPELFEKEFINVPLDFDVNLLSENTSINYITLKNDEIAHIDFTDEFISEMNAGAGLESMILQSIVNTIAGYYGVDNVYISIDGAPYSSGHIQIGEDEFFQKNLSNSVFP